MFSAGMGIGLVFYGAAEPMADFAAPPMQNRKRQQHIQKHYVQHSSIGDSMRGIWCCCISTYAQFRKGEPGLISRTLRPILGNKELKAQLGQSLMYLLYLQQ